MDAFRGIAGRAIVISSADVYLAYGRLHGTEPGPLEPMPLTEDSALRSKLGPEGESYNKIGVEAAVRGDAQLPVTVVRYPAVYGPGDRQRRFYGYVRRMADNRPAILVGATEAGFRFSHAYCADAAHAVALVAAEPSTAGHVYNVAEPATPATEGRIRRLAAVMGWRGDVLVLPDAEMNPRPCGRRRLPATPGDRLVAHPPRAWLRGGHVRRGRTQTHFGLAPGQSSGRRPDEVRIRTRGIHSVGAGGSFIRVVTLPKCL